MKKKKRTEEISAGGLIVYKGTDGWYILLMKDKSDKWTFPKGKIENGESVEETAEREIAEEVGITGLTRIAELSPVMYWYYRNGAIYKTVRYFVFTAPVMTKPVVQTEEGISEARWVRVSEAADSIGYPETNKPLLASVVDLLQ